MSNNGNIHQDKVAIIGMGCRFPGNSDTPEKFWELLLQGKNVVGDIPKDRWETSRFCNDHDNASAKSYVRKGHFIDWDYKKFDAGFFGFAPREVEYFDPQQRLLLEVAWEAMENAGLDVTQLAGGNIGVYAGGFTLDHMLNQLGSGGRSQIGTHSAAGATLTMLSNRISYAFDFCGPSISVDTACSSSLVALSYAVQDIQNGAAEMALVGGVNFMLRPEYPIAMSKGQFLAKDGRSKSFDANGDGYGRGEGAGILVLKPLSKAQTDGDNILAVVDAAGVNQDGRTSGITVPNGESQQSLMQRLAEESGINPDSVQYVEAHGTGTPVGDPIEASAIAAVYGQGRSKGRSQACPIGSVKSNIGHLEAAAGVAGLIKICLMLKHNQVPALATLQSPNPAIPFGENGLALADKLQPLSTKEGARRVAINSFGYGGTNAHAILSSFDSNTTSRASDENAKPSFMLLPLSSRDENALPTQALTYADKIKNNKDSLQDILFSLTRHRSHLSHRLAIWGETADELVTGLEKFAAENMAENSAQGIQAYQGDPRVVFVYTGMGPQWWGMGQSLYQNNKAFKYAMDEADQVFKKITGYSIKDEMMKTESTSNIQQTHLAQPANFVIQYALTQAMAADGLQADAVVGHSVGEISSAWASGMLDLKEALTVAVQRSCIQAKAAGKGGMLAVGLSEDDLQIILKGKEQLVSIAAINSATNITLSGDQATLDQIQGELESRDIFARPLTVEVPYHSPMMEPLLAELSQALANLKPKSPTLPLYSTVTGDQVKDFAYDADYWCRNVRHPVYFEKAIKNMLQEGHTIFVEVGPHPVLRNALKDIAKAEGVDIRLVQTLNRKQDETSSFYRSFAEVYVQGGKVDWASRHPCGQRLSLPNYPWQRETLWRESERQRRDRMTGSEQPLLGVAELDGSAWLSELSDQRLNFLQQHVVDGVSIMPAAAYLETMLEAASEMSGNSHTAFRMTDISIEKALVLDSNKALFQQLRHNSNARNMELYSYDDQNPAQLSHHASSWIYSLAGAQVKQKSIADIAAALDLKQATESVYSGFAKFNMQYGPLFQPIVELKLSQDRQQVLAHLQLPEQLQSTASAFIAHPSLLDGCFQTVLSLLKPEDGAFLPTAIKSLKIYQNLSSSLWCHGVLTHRSARKVECDLTIMAGDGSVQAEITGLVCSGLDGGKTEQPYPSADYHYVWNPQPLTDAALTIGTPTTISTIRTPTSTAVGGATIGGTIGIPTAKDQQWVVVADEGVLFAEMLSHQLSEITGQHAQHLSLDRTDLEYRLSHSRFNRLVFLTSSGLSENIDPVATHASGRLLAVLQALAEREHDSRVYVVTREAFAVTETDKSVIPAQATLVGLTRVAFNELGKLRPTTIDMPRTVDGELMNALLAELCVNDPTDEVALRHEGRFYSELKASDIFSEQRQLEFNATQNQYFNFAQGAGTGEVTLVSTQAPRLNQHQLELKIEAINIDAANVEQALNDLQDPDQLMVVCGKVTRSGSEVNDWKTGDRVCGLVPVSLSSHIQINSQQCLLVAVPESVSSESVGSKAIDAELIASTVIVQAMADRIAHNANLTNNDRVLVCSTPPGLALGKVLEKQGINVVPFPANPQQWNAEDLSEALSHGQLTAIAAPLNNWDKQFGFSDLAEGGCLIELNQQHAPLRCDKRIGKLVRLDIRQEMARKPEALQQAMENAISKVISQGLTPVNNTATFDLASLAEQNSTQLSNPGMLLVRFSTEQTVMMTAQDNTSIDTAASYLVTGGFGGLGKETASWLAEQGAGQIILASRNAGDKEGDQQFLQQLENSGCRAVARACDIANLSSVKKLIDEFGNGPFPLKGIFHTAGVVADKAISEMSQQDLQQVMQPKAQGAWNLHNASQHLSLDHFVLYSSISVLVGNSNQANYCAANGFLDALAHLRRSQGLAGLSLNWGAIDSVGMLSQDENAVKHLGQIGLTPIPFNLGLRGMARSMDSDINQVCITNTVDWNKWARFEHFGRTSTRFRILIDDAMAKADDSNQARLSAKLATLNIDQRHAVLTGLITEILARELKMPADKIDASRPLESLGVDSLMATEIRVGLDDSMGISVSALELIGEGTISHLASKGLAQMKLDSSNVAAA